MRPLAPATRTEHRSSTSSQIAVAQFGLYLPVLNGIPQPSRGPPEAGATLWLSVPTARRPNVDRTADDVMAGHITILLVEDNPDDEALTAPSAAQRHDRERIEVARDGQEALDYLVGDRATTCRGWCCST